MTLLDPLINMAEEVHFPAYAGNTIRVDRDAGEYLYTTMSGGLVDRWSFGLDAICDLLYDAKDQTSRRMAATRMLAKLREDMLERYPVGCSPYFIRKPCACDESQVFTLAHAALPVARVLRTVTLLPKGELTPGIAHVPGESSTIVLLYEEARGKYPITLAKNVHQDSPVGLVIRTSRIAIFKLSGNASASAPALVAAAPAAAVNDHTCPTCKNTRCSRAEKTCWRCGGNL